MLDRNLLDQVQDIFLHLSSHYTFRITCNLQHEQAQELIEFLDDVAGCSDKLSCQLTETDEPRLEFSLLKEGEETGVTCPRHSRRT